MANQVIVYIERTYGFEWITAIITCNSWIKLFLKLKQTKQFGPLIKIITVMF